MEMAHPGEAGITAAVAKGTSWTVLSRLGSQVFSIISATVVARLVAPRAYGLIGMAQVIIGFAGLFRDIGTATAIIQRQDEDEELLGSVFWLNVAMGLGVTVCSWLVAPWVARFYREPAVLGVFQALSLSFLITSLSNVHSALLSRRFRFGRIAAAELTGGSAGLVAAITAAVLGAGVWSLVTASLVSAAASTIVMIMLASWRPKMLFSWKKIKDVAGFGLNLSAFNIVNYFARNADNLLIGKYVGASALGYYGFAYNLMLYPVQAISQTLGRVLFPAFARMQEDYTRFGQAYLRSCAAIAFVTFPMMTGMTILAGEFITVLLGSRWAPVAPVLRILAPVGMVQSVVTTVGQIYSATGRTDLLFRWGSAAAVLMVLSFIVGLPWGMLGVATAYAFVSMMLAVPVLWLAMRVIRLPLRQLAKALKPVMVCTTVMATAVIPLRHWLLLLQTPSAAVLVVCTGVGASVYLSLMYRYRPMVWRDILMLVSTLVRKRGASARDAALA